ncbi:LuxR C-terminal-related transcriptional regulator [Escherichia coli]|nr:response regulator transcription factor [Escherichia coli]HBA8760577.1 response regulator transcription factor [Escherichia coli]
MTNKTVKAGFVMRENFIKESISNSIELIEFVNIEWNAINSNKINDYYFTNPVDIIIAEYRKGGYDESLSVIRRVRNLSSKVKIVFFTDLNDYDSINTLLNKGANAFISYANNSKSIINAINKILLFGKEYICSELSHEIMKTRFSKQYNKTLKLTYSELRVVDYLCLGLKIDEISRLLHKSQKTISNQKLSAMQKLGVKTDIALYKKINHID